MADLAPQEGESSKAHLALLDYVFMDVSKRSIRALHQQYVERAEAGADVPTTRLPTLFAWSSQFGWQLRARQYDAEERERKLLSDAETRASMNKRHMQIAQALQGRVLQWLKDPENQLDTFEQVLSAFRIATDIERRAMGVPDTVLALAALPDNELMKRHAELLRRLEQMARGEVGQTIDEADAYLLEGPDEEVTDGEH